MAFRNKAEFILAHKPDILVIPECEHPDKLIFKDDTPKPTAVLWFGKNRNKGLGVFSYSDFRFKVLKIHNDQFKMIVPIKVSEGPFDFTLFAVWANNPQDPDGQYVTQVWKAIRLYEKIIRAKRTLLIGDFNSNAIWDKPRREGNHSTVVDWLGNKKIHSVYHKHFNQLQGGEQHPTFYLYKRKDKPYHLDYCFASVDMIEHLESVEVGEQECWSKYSDHMPVMATFNLSRFV